jgi:uncharacterized cupin superfamily protein
VGAGWFIVNASDAPWERIPGFGARCRFEDPDDRFPNFGLSLRALQPGEAASLYHAETTQEGFLVLEGQCLAVIDGEERRLRAWDYFHCPPETRHVLVGAGDDPCSLIAIGSPRTMSLDEVEYPADEAAARHGAAATRTTHSSKEAYADRPTSSTSIAAPWPPEG